MFENDCKSSCMQAVTAAYYKYFFYRAVRAGDISAVQHYIHSPIINNEEILQTARIYAIIDQKNNMVLFLNNLINETCPLLCEPYAPIEYAIFNKALEKEALALIQNSN